MTLRKDEIIRRVAQETGVSARQAEQIIFATLGLITNTVAEGGKVQLAGFGTFDSRVIAGREGRNPHTGEPMTFKESRVPTFKALTGFRDAVKAGQPT